MSAALLVIGTALLGAEAVDGEVGAGIGWFAVLGGAAALLAFGGLSYAVALLALRRWSSPERRPARAGRGVRPRRYAPPVAHRDPEDAVTEAPAPAEPITGALVALLERCAEEIAAERGGAVARELAVAGAAPDPGADYRGWSSV